MTRAIVGVVIAASTLLGPFGGKVHRKTEEGNRAYELGEYEQALLDYTEAQEQAPDAPELHYNLGNVLYRQDDFEEARKSFTQALLSKIPGLTSAAAYNLGNALYREERYDEAVDAYRRALMEDPDDPDAKRNLELALRALEAQQQEQQGQQQQQQQQQQGEEGEPNEEPRDQEEQSRQQDEGSSSEGKDSKQEQQQQQPDASEQEPQQDQSPRPEPSEGEGQMTREEAARLLDNLDEQERDAQLRRAMRQAQQETRTAEEDW